VDHDSTFKILPYNVNNHEQLSDFDYTFFMTFQAASDQGVNEEIAQDVGLTPDGTTCNNMSSGTS
jgi:hypothetical protein